MTWVLVFYVYFNGGFGMQTLPPTDLATCQEQAIAVTSPVGWTREGEPSEGRMGYMYAKCVPHVEPVHPAQEGE